MTLSKFFLSAAGLLCFAGLLLHEFAGTPTVLPPLSTTDLPAEVIWLHHFSWHVGSVALGAMGVLFVWPAVTQSPPFPAFFASAMSSALGVLGVSLAIGGHEALWGTPAPYLWWPIAALGFAGAVTAPRRG